MRINWFHFPQSSKPSEKMLQTISAFDRVHAKISSSKFDLNSNAVLAVVSPELQKIGFRVESGKTKVEKIGVPVFYGENGSVEKSFDADAYHEREGIVLEVEAGRGVVNNQFLKDLFQACMMDGVSQLCIAVRQTYKGQRDFNTVVTFMHTLFASRRLELPLKSIVIIGY
jgi:hypothetical protein